MSILYDQLLETSTETLWAEDSLGSMTFSWFLRGQQRGLPESEIAELCEQAYAEITRRHALHLEWLDWPAVGTAGRPAAPDTPLDFDIGTSGEIESPFLALVPDPQALRP